MFCLKCGAAIPEQNKFCPRCATPVLISASGRNPAAAPTFSTTSAPASTLSSAAAAPQPAFTPVAAPASLVADLRAKLETPIGDLARPAGFWIRLVARLIDGIVLLILLAILLAVLFMAGAPLIDWNVVANIETASSADVEAQVATLAGIFLVFYLLQNLLDVAYEVVLHAAWGCTVGKWILGLRVVGADGNRISFGRSFIRWIGIIVSFVPILIGFIWAAFDRRKQAFHDKIAGTYVVHRI